MDERRLQDILGQKLEVPDMVNKKLEETYAQLEGKERPAKRKGFRAVRTVLIAAAAIALLCGTAAAAYGYYIRQSVPVDQSQMLQGILGDGQPSWDESHEFDELGMEKAYPRREVVSTDPMQAQALLGSYLPESGYRWQIEDYTLAVESYVLDEHTGTAKFYYTLEHPGGFGDGAVDWQHGMLDWAIYQPMVTFIGKSGADQIMLGGRTYVDVARSTEEKLYIVESVARNGGWKAEDGLYIDFRIQGAVREDGLKTYREDEVLFARLELPGLKSLPVVSASDPAAGTVAELSAIGLKLSCEDMDQVGRIVLDYADGTQYVVRDKANGLDNSDYGFGSGEVPNMTLRRVFNRLVDPSQVTAVTVDGQRYEIG